MVLSLHLQQPHKNKQNKKDLLIVASSRRKGGTKGLFFCKRYDLLAFCFLNYVLGFFFQGFCRLFHRILRWFAQCNNSSARNAPKHHSKQHVTVHIQPPCNNILCSKRAYLHGNFWQRTNCAIESAILPSYLFWLSGPLWGCLGLTKYSMFFAKIFFSVRISFASF